MVPPSSAEEKKEIELVKKVEWRILSASGDDDKLQRFLGVYLAPLLLKAGSPYANVRTKVIQVCQTINKLVTSPT